MRIVCPNCDTAYEAPESVVTPGRHMRCAQCRSEWMPGGPAEAAASPRALQPDAAPAPAPSGEPQAEHGHDATAPEQPAPPELVIHAPFPQSVSVQEPPRRAVMAAWAASLLALVLLIWMAIAFRHPVMRYWPASARAYAGLGYK